MTLIVQKYGGTSVGSTERIQTVAQRVQQTVQAGNAVVVVVSAMGKTTDTLVKLANEVSTQPSRREMDMLLSTGEQVSIALLSMALQELGQPAISLTGAQVGIVTEADHSRARILHIQTDRLERHLKDSKVVVVAGFQGVSRTADLEITTLGRGGSDTSAVALAAALRASCCEIYTDVPGILTTDPRLVPEAQLMSEITCNEMLELASLGAKVLHPRAVEIARNYGMPLVVRSSWTADPGTRVISPIPQPRSLENLEIARPVDGVSFDTDQAKVSLLRIPDRPGIAACLFGEISQQALSVDLIIQSIHEANTNDIAFTVSREALTRAEAVAEAIAPSLGLETSQSNEAEVMVDRDVAKVSISGAGMIGRPGVAAQMFATLAEAQVNIRMISTSEVQVSCLIGVEDCDHAIAALCEVFDIHCSPVDVAIARTQPSDTPSQPLPAVRGVALDTNQARVAIRRIPDAPGMAAKLFLALAEQGISVDTIIQSQRCHLVGDVPTRDIAFTVLQSDAESAQTLLEQLGIELGFGVGLEGQPFVWVDRAIAKVSAVGAGMESQPGVAARLFEALAQENINIQMIATSEIKISCVVDEAQGVAALQAIHQAFGLAQPSNKA